MVERVAFIVSRLRFRGLPGVFLQLAFELGLEPLKLFSLDQDVGLVQIFNHTLLLFVKSEDDLLHRGVTVERENVQPP